MFAKLLLPLFLLPSLQERETFRFQFRFGQEAKHLEGESLCTVVQVGLLELTDQR